MTLYAYKIAWSYIQPIRSCVMRCLVTVHRYCLTFIS